MSDLTGQGPVADAIYDALSGSFGDFGGDHAKKAADAAGEVIAKRITFAFRALATERAQMDDMNGSRHFHRAAEVASKIAKGGDL